MFSSGLMGDGIMDGAHTAGVGRATRPWMGSIAWDANTMVRTV